MTLAKQSRWHTLSTGERERRIRTEQPCTHGRDGLRSWQSEPAAHGVSIRGHQLAVANGARRGQVIEARHRRIFDRPNQEIEEVVDADPRHPLPATPHRSGESESGESSQLTCRRVAAAADTDRWAQQDRSPYSRACVAERCFPTLTHLDLLAWASRWRWCGFIDLGFSCIAKDGERRQLHPCRGRRVELPQRLADQANRSFPR